MANVTITLIEPIEGHDGQIKQVVMREPKYIDFMTLGEPSTYAQSEGGLFFQSEKDGVVQQYIERLTVEPADKGLLAQLTLTDTIQLKNVVTGFFIAAREAISS